MSHQKVTSKFPTAERLALSSRQQDPPHPNKPPREGRPFLLLSPPKPRRPKPLIESEVAKHRGSTNSLADNATQKRRYAPARGTAARMREQRSMLCEELLLER
jgi:hypothetical protein